SQHQAVLDAGNDGDLAYLRGQDEMHFTLNRFLIAAKACGQAFRIEALDRWDRTIVVDDAMDGSGLRSAQPSGSFGQNRCGVHPPGDGFAVQEALIPRLGFERMAERMAEV